MGPDEFVALYRQEAEAVLLFHTRRTFDAESAVELTAETFAEAWRCRTSLRATTHVEQRAWLFTIARRRWGASLKRRRVERSALVRLGVQLPAFHEDDLAAVEERAGLRALRAALGRELAALSGEQRRALQLRVVEDRPYEEVARMLAISEPAARARVSRALRSLAGALDQLSSSAAGMPGVSCESGGTR